MAFTVHYCCCLGLLLGTVHPAHIRIVLNIVMPSWLFKRFPHQNSISISCIHRTACQSHPVGCLTLALSCSTTGQFIPAHWRRSSVLLTSISLSQQYSQRYDISQETRMRAALLSRTVKRSICIDMRIVWQ
jgi:hypothetical protein